MTRCGFCGEIILKGERAPGFGEPLHVECVLRLVVGSIAHIERRCSCFVPGSTESDPLTMTKREAARAAALLYGAKERRS